MELADNLEEAGVSGTGIPLSSGSGTVTGIEFLPSRDTFEAPYSLRQSTAKRYNQRYMRNHVSLILQVKKISYKIDWRRGRDYSPPPAAHPFRGRSGTTSPARSLAATRLESNRGVLIKPPLPWSAKKRPKTGPFFYRLAEREGFEPPVRANGQRFSRPPHSTTLPPLQTAHCQGQFTWTQAAWSEAGHDRCRARSIPLGVK